MSLDKKYISLGYLQSYFVDKDTGKPLSGGKVYFYRDNQRTIPKTVYQLVGSPNAYNYNPLPNPCTLGVNGTFVDDSGNDIEVYSFPYIISGNSTSDDLYYIQVTDRDGVTQFTREAVPADMVGIEDEITPVAQSIGSNFLTNGQFNIVNSDLVLDVSYSGSTNRGVYPYFAGTTLSSAKVMPILGNPSYIKVGDCFLLQSNLDSSTTISIKTNKNNPIAGFSAIEANPMNYFCYSTSATAGDNYRYLFVVVDKLPALAGSNMAASCWVNANLAGNTLSAVVAQLYLNDNNNSITITPPTISNNNMLKLDFEKALFQFQVPTIDYSKYNSSGYLLVGFSLPLNTAITINITDLQFYKIDSLGEGAKDYPYVTYDKVYSTVDTLPKIPDYFLPDPSLLTLTYRPAGIVELVNSYLGTAVSSTGVIYKKWKRVINAGSTSGFFGQTDAQSIYTNFRSITNGWIPVVKVIDPLMIRNIKNSVPIYKFSSLSEYYLLNNAPRFDTSNLLLSGLGVIEGKTISINSNEVGTPSLPPTCSEDNAFTINITDPGTSSSYLSFYITCNNPQNITSSTFIKVSTVSSGIVVKIVFVIDGVMPLNYTSDNDINSNDIIYAYIYSNYTTFQIMTTLGAIFNPLMVALAGGVSYQADFIKL